MPRMRGRLYSSWASSTWSLPSAVWAWPAKMSRMTAVRSTMRMSRRFSSARCCVGVSSSSQTTATALVARDRGGELVELAGAQVGARVGLRAVLR